MTKNSKLHFLLDFPYFDHYLSLALIERQLAATNQDSKMIFIGSGPMPLTAISFAVIEILLHQQKLDLLQQCLPSPEIEPDKAALANLLQTIDPQEFPGQLHILCVERDIQAVGQSRKLLKALSLDKIISVEYCDGCHLEVPDNYDTFFIASMVNPKTKVLSNILETINYQREIKILIRSVEKSNLRELLYDTVEAELEQIEKYYPGFIRQSDFFPRQGSRLINSFYVYSFKRPNKKRHTLRNKAGLSNNDKTQSA